MLISFSWLKQYLDLPDSISADEVAQKLTMSTVEVEGVENMGATLEGIVVGKVLSAEKHPNADKLKVCKVDVGNEHLQIVCGGSNVSEGMLCAVAKLGAKVKWHGEGELIEMKEAEIRGVKSFGMISASTEIGLGEMFPPKDEKEILDLTDRVSAKAGTPLAEALGLDDAVIDIDNKSMTNRPDLWGHYGMAREVAALFKKELKKYEAPEIKSGSDFKLKVKVEDTKLCPRYMVVAVAGIKVGPSPAWLAQKLLAVGLRPINNIVDITNYIAYDLGEPMHAFDANFIAGEQIVVRHAADGEKFKTLDGVERELNASMLVIADKTKAVALAGVMGGENSGINDGTTTIIFEAANFSAPCVRKTALALGLRTDSSARFEKALDPNWCELALRRAVELTLQICPEAKVVSKVIDEKNFRLFRGPIELSWEFLYKKIGAEIDKKEVVSILTRLGFEVTEKKNELKVMVPSWRATKDISIPEDLVEEVARIYGYNDIPTQLPVFPIVPPEKNKMRSLEHNLRMMFSFELGYSESCNYSFVSGAQVENLGDEVSKYLELDNPLAKDKPYLRRNLLPNLLENISFALANNDEVKIYEIGQVFSAHEPGVRASKNSDDLLPRQDTWFTAVFASKKDDVPFWSALRAWELVGARLGVDVSLLPPDKVCAWEHPARLALAAVDGKVCGVVNELHPFTADKFGIDARVGILRVNLDQLVKLFGDKKFVYTLVPNYPVVTRDLSLQLKKDISHGEIVAAVSALDPLLKKVELFDVYEGATVGEGYKSMAYHFTFASPERTLTTAEVDAVIEKIIQTLTKKFSATVRK